MRDEVSFKPRNRGRIRKSHSNPRKRYDEKQQANANRILKEGQKANAKKAA